MDFETLKRKLERTKDPRKSDITPPGVYVDRMIALMGHNGENSKIRDFLTTLLYHEDRYVRLKCYQALKPLATYRFPDLITKIMEFTIREENHDLIRYN